MHRYAVISKGLNISQLKEEVERCGGRNLKVLSSVGQIFCHLDDSGRARLEATPGLVVKVVKKVGHQEVRAPVPILQAPSATTPATYATSQSGLLSGFYAFRAAFDPPITGLGCTIAILDSGIRKSHEGLKGKVVYEENFSDSPTVDDIFDHGVGVAYIAAGGRHAPSEESGLAPDAYLWNMKVLDDNGEGSEENVVAAIERCIELDKEAIAKELPRTDPMNLGIINMSFGAPDDGDPDNPIRAAVRSAVEETQLIPIAAAGNGGPAQQTITCPATDPLVIAVGSMTFSPFRVWDLSSRGPTKEGLVKPDVAGYGVRMLTASAKADDAYVVKSGTSFSAPVVSGGFATMWEGMRRQYGEGYFEGVERIFEMTPYMCVKPEDAPREKDNDYGWGLLSGLVAAELGKGMVPMAAITEMVVPILGLGMVGMMMASMAKGLK